ncbi:MAG: 50S ribosomal protein L14 [Nanoarchaeota archaeon]|nr:50S ribosomal protein L14 [Nanoarchaeota archaeon]MBU1135262.1 50S ribosomal protein L14 [Nanoarchaeota archaeon]MBU2519888.1 50S ribosomal protein L14 [Nanoarchaeota archaeon]
MKALPTNPTKALSVGSQLNCIDNSGAKVLEIIAVRGYKGKRRAKPRAGVATLVMCKVIKGSEKVRKQVFKAVIVRQKKEYRRSNGMRIKFEDNAAVLVDDKFESRGTLIKGPIAKEVVQRFPIIGKIASTVV